ncbi:MAG TPA: putative zinc-binding peptidase [Polyangiaceae bacterium]|nr:putative zinc-binding peptidase [Polyangiaceae bacterium]
MKLFTCSACKNVIFFENSQCTRCGHTLAYLADSGVLSALEQPTDGTAGAWRALDPAVAGARYRLCKNYTTYAVCNWAIPEEDEHELCLACRLNETIPDLSAASALASWQGLEIAKRRLVYTLLELGLPLDAKQETSEHGLAFAFKSDGPDGERVLTGHCDGLVTINLKEADSPAREQARVALGERYRTLLGHFRHESGHYYWDRLLKDREALPDFRKLFGDEQQDYAESVKRHYESPKQNWSDEYVSAYATMHPWEDWAETWAHYLHMVDTLETAQSYGLALKPQAVGGAQSEAVTTRRVRFEKFSHLIAAWIPLTVALNSLNRSMGLADAYPFVLGERVIEKLGFVHELIAQAGRGTAAQLEPTAQRASEERAPSPGNSAVNRSAVNPA